MYRTASLLFLLLLLLAGPGVPAEKGAVALDQALIDLSGDLRVACLAAHPDDEDSATLAWLRRGCGAETWVLLMTNGEGGQNEIGGDLYEDLAAVRRRETLAAAEITGSRVEFLGFPDFGYSLSADEAFEVWGREEILCRLVGAVRRVRPHVVITNHDDRTGHGHHRASGAAILEVFKAAADPERYPEEGEPWEIRKLYVASDAKNASALVPVGRMDRIRGLSYAEMGLRALKEHRSQGTWDWVALEPGTQTRPYRLVLARGELPGESILGGLPRPRPEWLTEEYRSGTREEILARVLALRERPEAERPPEAKIDRAAALAQGLDLVLDPPREPAVIGRPVRIGVYLRNAGETPVELPALDASVPARSGRRLEAVTATPESSETVVPVSVAVRVGEAKSVIHVTASVTVRATPPVTLHVAPWGRVFRPASALVDPEEERTRFRVEIANHGGEEITEDLRLRIEGTDRIRIEEPGRVTVPAGLRRWIRIRLNSKEGLEEGLYPVTVEYGEAIARDVLRVLDVRIPDELNVGVVTTYGDDVVQFLRSVGISPVLLTDQDLIEEKLEFYNTIYLGIRPYLARPILRRVNGRLLKYVENGGHLIVNYSKDREWSPEFAPYLLEIGRERVTDERAPVVFEDPQHIFLTKPNKVEPEDFDGWIQERGLYFPSRWDEESYNVILTSADAGNPQIPGLVFARYGRGTYVYTTFVWYRQLRHLNPAAMKVVANMISYPWW